jgi:hypothetical protein
LKVGTNWKEAALLPFLGSTQEEIFDERFWQDKLGLVSRITFLLLG